MCAQLRRNGVTGLSGGPVARCTVERLMRTLGLRGARRGQPVITTWPDRQSDRAPDLVDRDFTAQRPNQLWVVDMTYVPTWSGMVFTAFVSDVYTGGSSAGAAPPGCPPSYPSTPWKWRSGPGNALVRQLTGDSTG